MTSIIYHADYWIVCDLCIYVLQSLFQILALVHCPAVDSCASTSQEFASSDMCAGTHISYVCGETHISRDMCAGTRISRGHTYHCDTGLERSGAGIRINGRFNGEIAYADDLSLLSSREGMQMLLPWRFVRLLQEITV